MPETYREAYERIQEILEQLGKDDCDPDNMSAYVEEAAKLIEFCRERLKNTEMKVNDVLKNLEKKQEPDEIR